MGEGVHSTTVELLLGELRNGSGAAGPPHLVVLHPQEPTDAMLELLSLHDHDLTYLRGSALRSEDLDRCDLAGASAALIVSPKDTDDAEHSDGSTLMRLNQLRNHSPQVPVFVQAIQHEPGSALLTAAGAPEGQQVCLDQLYNLAVVFNSVNSWGSAVLLIRAPHMQTHVHLRKTR